MMKNDPVLQLLDSSSKASRYFETCPDVIVSILLTDFEIEVF